MQYCASSNKIKENKYKILRMSLLLGSDSDDEREETLNNFETAAREIDAMNDEVYLHDLEDKFYDTIKLEEEEKKLEVLVDYIGGRVEQRISLLTDFANITGYDLQGLQPIKYYDKLDDYKERLKYIREYLNNTEQIEKLTAEIEEADNKLNEAYLNKATAEENNLKNEELLQDRFITLLKSIDLYNDLTEENIKEKLEEATYKVEESKKSLDIFRKSFATLSKSGISTEEEQEYLSYVEGAAEEFYNNKEQEYLLNIYNILTTKYQDYNNLLTKREEINDILYERINLRKELKIKNSDVLANIYDLLEKQYEDIKKQYSNIKKIEQLNEKINQTKEILNSLLSENQKVEILALLREFCIIDTYEELNVAKEELNELENSDELNDNIDNNIIPEIKTPEVTTTESNIVQEEILENNKELNPIEFEKESLPEQEIKANQVINVENATNIDLELVHSKASKVMQRVGDMLGIKTMETKLVTVTDEDSKEQLNNVETLKEEVENINMPPKKEESKSTIENPLFNNNINETMSLDPEFEQAINNIDDNNDFWFPSDTPDALNELPDLEISNDNFFANNNISDLQFPDLNINFGNNDSEEKQ